jgi:hypothetical protein
MMSAQGENNKLIQDSHLANGRRNLMIKAAISVPIIASVTARPVWASGISSISGNLSGNLSNHTHEESFYDGCSPGYWHKDSRYPVSAYGYTIEANTPFNSIFTIASGPKAYTAHNAEGFTFLIHQPTSKTVATQVERFTSACFMNSLADVNYPYTPDDIIDFYGYYYRNEISYDDAKAVLVNLIHNGGTDGEENDVC